MPEHAPEKSLPSTTAAIQNAIAANEEALGAVA